MAPCTWSSPHHRATFSPSLRASVPTSCQEILSPSHHHSLPPGTPSNRAICHTHTATVSPWGLLCHRYTTVSQCNLVRHLVRHRDITVPPGALPWNRFTTVPPGSPPNAPPCHLVHHRAAVHPCRRRTDTTHRHTFVHLRTWQLSIVQRISGPPETVWSNFTIWSVANNSNEYFTVF